MGDSLKQFMDRKEVLVLGTLHELEDRNKLKKKQIHDLSKPKKIIRQHGIIFRKSLLPKKLWRSHRSTQAKHGCPYR